MVAGTVEILYKWISEGFDVIQTSLDIAQKKTVALSTVVNDLGNVAKTMGLDFIKAGTDVINSLISTTKRVENIILYFKHLSDATATATVIGHSYIAMQNLQAASLTTETGVEIANTTAKINNIASTATLANTTSGLDVANSMLAISSSAAAAGTTAEGVAAISASGGLSLLTGVTNVLTAATMSFMTVILPLWPILLALSAIAFVLKAAWEANFLGIADIIDDTIGWIMDSFDWLFELLADFFDTLDDGGALMEHVFAGMRLALLPLLIPLKFLKWLIDEILNSFKWLGDMTAKITMPFKELGKVLDFLIAPLKFVSDKIDWIFGAVSEATTTPAGSGEISNATSITNVGGSTTKSTAFNTNIYGATPENSRNISEQFLGIVVPEIENQI